MGSKDPTIWFWGVLALGLVFSVFVLIARLLPPSSDHLGMMGGEAWGWGILMMATGALILIAVLVAVLNVLRVTVPPSAYAAYVPPSANALDVLDQRYARGEVRREDYLRIRGDLTRGPGLP